MACTFDQDLLTAYLDGEIGLERALEVEAHLSSCPNCSAEAQDWKEVRATIQSAEFYYRPPAALEAKIRKLLPDRSRKQRAAWIQHWTWAGGGAVFASLVLLLAFFLTRPVAPSPDQEMIASHIRSLMADHLMDVVSTDQHTVKPWFNGKLEFAPPVKDFAAEGFPLAGGRLDYVENRRVAVLVYRRALHVINLYVWPAADNTSSAFADRTMDGYNVISWKNGGFEFSAVSDLNAAELRRFAELVSP